MIEDKGVSVESDCSVPEKLVEVVAQLINPCLWLMLMLVPLNQLNFYLLLQVQLPIKIF